MVAATAIMVEEAHSEQLSADESRTDEHIN